MQLPGTPWKWQAEGQTLKLKGKRWKGIGELGNFLNFTVPNARRADPQPFARAFDQGTHRLQIDIPASLGDIVSVADAVTELRPATTYFANLCHKTEIS